MKQVIKGQLIEQLQSLPDEEQRRVLDFARALVISKRDGVPGKDLLRFAGSIDAEDLKLMAEAIEEGCERIDPRGW